MRRRLIGLLALTVCAQSPPAFDAASIKLSGPRSERNSEGGPGTSDPGQYSFSRATLLDLIALAYGVHYFQISSTTALDAQRFDLVAKIPAGATKEQFRAMMRGLLEERFHLKARVVSKEFPGMEMAVAKGGPKLKEAAPTADGRPHHSLRQSFDGGFTVIHVVCRQYTMADFADALPQPGGPSIVDKTGSAGRYDIDLDYTIERPNSAVDGPPGAPSAPDLAVALRQQLGLQLGRTKLILDVVLVDAVDKQPVEN